MLGNLTRTSELTAAQLQNNECQQVVQSLVDLAAANDAFAERLDVTLSQPVFEIVCANQKAFDHLLHERVNAFFLDTHNAARNGMGKVVWDDR